MAPHFIPSDSLGHRPSKFNYYPSQQEVSYTTSNMTDVVFMAKPAALAPEPARPWMQHWPAQPVNDNALSTGQLEGFQKGEQVILGGVAGSFDKVLYDTVKEKSKHDF